MAPLAFNAGPSTLYLGEPEAVAPAPLWPWVVGSVALIVLVTIGVVVFQRVVRTTRSPGERAADTLAELHRVDARTRKALDRCAAQLELKTPAGLLASPTALAEAIGRCESMKEKDKSALRELAIRVAQERAGRSVSVTA